MIPGGRLDIQIQELTNFFSVFRESLKHIFYFFWDSFLHTYFGLLRYFFFSTPHSIKKQSVCQSGLVGQFDRRFFLLYETVCCTLHYSLVTQSETRFSLVLWKGVKQFFIRSFLFLWKGERVSQSVKRFFWVLWNSLLNASFCWYCGSLLLVSFWSCCTVCHWHLRIDLTRHVVHIKRFRSRENICYI